MRVWVVVRPLVAAVLAVVPVAGVARTWVPTQVRASVVLDLPDGLDGRASQLTQIPRDCSRVPGGSRTDADGWVFNQPVPGGRNAVYLIAFIVAEVPDQFPVTVRIDEHGVNPVPIPTPTTSPTPSTSPTPGPSPTPSTSPPPSPSPTSSTTTALSPTFTPTPTGGPRPLPPEVAGGLLNGGADGAWLRTPPDWALLFGRLILDAASATTTTFDLVSVCLAGTPNPSTPTSAPPPRTGHASPELPATGNNAGPIAAAGVVLVFVGVAMVWLYRRRLAE